MNKKSVLLVEDDRASARLYQILLERQGWVVTVVTDGSDAFVEAHRQEYDIILLDLMLPNMDGLAMLSRLRAQKRFARTPIFLQTSADLTRIEALALEAGVTKVFSKSLAPAEIVESIMTIVAGLSPAPPSPTDEPAARISRDFRIPGKTAEPKPTLRMVEEPKPPPPPPPPFKPFVIPMKEDAKEPEKKGLLSRFFKPKPEDR